MVVPKIATQTKEATMTRIRDTSKKQPRIRITSKTQPLVDINIVAAGLGVDHMLSGPKKSKNGREYWEIRFFVKNVRIKRKKIYELGKKNARRHVLLGTAYGPELSICIYIAARHKDGFWERVCGYRFEAPDHGCALAVSFYEKR